MTTVMVIMVSNLDLCYESFGHTAYGSLHVDGIGIGEHVEVAIIFRDGLSAMSLVRSLFEPQKSVWLSMSFDVETGKNYRVFVVVLWGRGASQNKHPSWQGHSNARDTLISWLLVSGWLSSIKFRKINLLNSMLTEDLTCMRLSCGTSLPDLRCYQSNAASCHSTDAIFELHFNHFYEKLILEGQWLNCLFGRWSLLLSWFWEVVNVTSRLMPKRACNSFWGIIWGNARNDLIAMFDIYSGIESLWCALCAAFCSDFLEISGGICLMPLSMRGEFGMSTVGCFKRYIYCVK